MFKENDLVVYQGAGVCKITSIQPVDFGVKGEKKPYYYLEPLYQKGLIYAPVDSSEIKIREIICREEAQSLMGDIAHVDPDRFKGTSVQQTVTYYQQILDSHNCRDLLSMIKGLYLKELEAAERNKKLGQIDRKYLRRAEDLLFGELATVLDLSKDRVQTHIISIFNACNVDEEF